MKGAFQTQGVPVLKCPGCGTKVADGTAICPSCDYIIDSSFISTDSPRRGPAPTEEEEEPTSSLPAVAAPPPRTVRTNSGTPRGTPAARVTTAPGVRPKTASGTGSRPAVPANDGDTNIRSMEDILRSAPPRTSGRAPAVRPGGTSGSRPAAPPRREAQTELDSSDVNYVPTRPPPSSVHGTGQIMAPEELAADFKDFLGELGRSDKIVFFSALAIVLSAFLPWKETAEDGDILGLMSLGIIAILGALGIVGTIAVRVRRVMPGLNVLIPWMAQFGLSVACIVWCLIFMKISTDSTEVPSAVGKEIIRNSSPSFGAFLGLMGSLGCLAGTLLGLREKPQP
jgi:hypothetical protein